MTDTILTAIVAPIQFGVKAFEGLSIIELEKGKGEGDAIALQQAASIFQVIPTSAPKWLKARLGKDCSLFRVKTDRESVEGKRVRSTEIALSRLQFEQLLRKLDREGNAIAQDIVDMLVGVSLRQLWADGFKQKFDEEDRQEYYRDRQQHLKSFHPLYTSWLKADANGDCGKVNWGTEVNALKTAAKLPLTPVNEYDRDQLSKLNQCEHTYNALRKIGLTHAIALNSL